MIPSTRTDNRQGFACRFLFVLFVILFVQAPRAHAAAQTSLVVSSESGDYVGAGLNYNYSASSGSYSVQRNVRNGVTVTFTTFGGQTWKMDFAAPGNVPLTPGVWLSASTFSGDPALAGLSISAFGRSCTETAGSFQVKQVTYGSTGNVTAFWATFAQHCNGSAAILSGDLRYRADLPVFITAPPAIRAIRGEEVFFDVQAGGSSTGALLLSTSALPAGATFGDNGNRTGSFDWLTTPDQLGDHVLTFYATNSLGATDSAVSVIQVSGLTDLRTESDPDDIVGQGASAALSSEDAAFNAREENGAVIVTVTSTTMAQTWTLTFAGPDGAPLATGDYLDAGALPNPGSGRPGLSISCDGRACSDLTGEFHVRELVRDASGILCFRARFEQRCGGSPSALRGEIRVNAAVPIDISAPYGMTVDPGQFITFYVLATDPFFSALSLSAAGLPQGASFTDYGDNSGLFTWMPGTTQSGLHRITFTAADGNGGAESVTTLIDVTGTAVLPPVAVVGGPYSGETGTMLSFDGSASSSPDGNLIGASWDFGDGATASGLTAQHTYAAPGSYRVLLTVCNASLCASDSTVATITSPPLPPVPPPPTVLASRAFAGPGDNPLRLNTGKPHHSIVLEPVNASWALTSLDFGSIILISEGTGQVSQIGGSVRMSSGGDRDGNGVPDVEATFTTADLRTLLSQVSGKVDLPFRIQGVLRTGEMVYADFHLMVWGGADKLNNARVTVTSTGSEIHFALEQPGFVRIQLFDLMGRPAATLLEESVGAGEHVVPAQRRGAAGGPMAAGVYFYRMETPDGISAGHVVIAR
jgi:hypothetical protein